MKLYHTESTVPNYRIILHVQNIFPIVMILILLILKSPTRSLCCRSKSTVVRYGTPVRTVNTIRYGTTLVHSTKHGDYLCTCVCVWDVFIEVSTRLGCQAHLYDRFPHTARRLSCLRATVPAHGYKYGDSHITISHCNTTRPGATCG